MLVGVVRWVVDGRVLLLAGWLRLRFRAVVVTCLKAGGLDGNVAAVDDLQFAV